MGCILIAATATCKADVTQEFSCDSTAKNLQQGTRVTLRCAKTIPTTTGQIRSMAAKPQSSISCSPFSYDGGEKYASADYSTEVRFDPRKGKYIYYNKVIFSQTIHIPFKTCWECVNVKVTCSFIARGKAVLMSSPFWSATPTERYGDRSTELWPSPLVRKRGWGLWWMIWRSWLNALEWVAEWRYRA